MAKALRYLMGITAGIAMVMILLITAFEAAMYSDLGFYEKEYRKYDVLSDLDMKMDDVMYVTEEMMEYLRGNRGELSVITTVEGKERDFFNEQDRFHMWEVQGLFIGGLHLRTGAVVVLIACLVVLFLGDKERMRTDTIRKERIKILCRSYQIVLVILAVLITGLGIWVVQDFNTVFTLFHEIFFDNDLWIFDPAEDYMIRMLPEGLFYDFVIRIGGIFVAGLIALLALSMITVKIYNKNAIEQKKVRNRNVILDKK